MEKKMICISCPIGCPLTVSYNEKEDITYENIQVNDNKCPRGLIYGKEEILAPKRTVTATCEIDSLLMSRIPVKTTGPVMKEQISLLLEELYRIKLTPPVKMGDVIISDFNNCAIDIVATRSLLS